MPPSSTADQNGNEPERYVVAPSGHTAHPDEIIASCQALREHIQKVQDDAEKTMNEWEQGLKEEELAEKRRVAPGWLDRDEKILQPSRANIAEDSPRATPDFRGKKIIDNQDEAEREQSRQARTPDPAGEALDRAFGGMGITNR